MPDRVIENVTVDFMQTEGITSKFQGIFEFSIQLLFLIPGKKENKSETVPSGRIILY